MTAAAHAHPVVQCIARAYAARYPSDRPLDVVVVAGEVNPTATVTKDGVTLVIGMPRPSIGAYERLPEDVATAWLQIDPTEAAVPTRDQPVFDTDRLLRRLRSLSFKTPPSQPGDTSAEIPEIVAAAIDFARGRSEREREATCKLLHKAVEIAQWWGTKS